MGFDGIGILFRDTKTDNLFTISDTFDEADLRVIKEYEEKLKRGELLSDCTHLFKHKLKSYYI